MGVVRVIVILLRAFLLPRAALAAENLALRQQLADREKTLEETIALVHRLKVQLAKGEELLRRDW